MTTPNACHSPATAPRAHFGVLGLSAADERHAQRLEDAAFVERLLADDATAWRDLSQRYTRMIYSCIHRVLSRFSRVTGDNDADEVYARLCLDLLANDKKKLRTYDPERGSRLSSWLGLLATHAAYDYLRSVRRDSSVEPLSETTPLCSPAPSPFERALLGQRARLAVELMRGLSERDREFVELYFGEGLSPEVVSEQMGISVKTVYSKKHKITARLEALMQSRAAA